MASSIWIDSTPTSATQQVGPVADNTAAPPFSFTNDLTTGLGSSAASTVDVMIGGTSRARVTSTGLSTVGLTLSAAAALATATLTGKITNYNSIATAGWGVPVIQAAARATAQTAANASVATYTVGAADGSFDVSMNLNCTAATSLITTLTCTYTDESNTARTMILPVAQLSGSFIALGAVTGVGAWETPVMHLRCKAATAITLLTSAGTFTGVTYTVEGVIKQTA